MRNKRWWLSVGGEALGRMQAQGSTLLSDWCFRSRLQLHLLTDVLGHCYDSPSDWCFRSLLRLTFWLMFQVTVTTPPSDWCFRSLLWLHLLTDVSGHCYDSTSMQPPRGLQFILGTPTRPAVVDTIVMANLVSHFVCSCTLGSMSCPCMNGMSPRQSPGHFYVTWWLNFGGLLSWDEPVRLTGCWNLFTTAAASVRLCVLVALHSMFFPSFFSSFCCFFSFFPSFSFFPFFPLPVFFLSFFVCVVLCLFFVLSILVFKLFTRYVWQI